ncbi:unnamed protein product [Urochloa humidicola]
MTDAAAVGNNNAAAESCIKPASSLEAKTTKRAAMKPMKPEPPLPKVVAVKTEIISRDDIHRLLRNPITRPTPPTPIFFKLYPHLREGLAAAHAAINRVADVHEDIAKQYKEKGFVVMGVEHLDNGKKRLFSLPQEARPGESVVA